jgi:phospholipase C
MSTCTKWVTKAVLTCKNWTSKIDQECTQWADEGSQKCSQWADEGSQKCSQWADEGSQKCSQWKDEGTKKCTSWEKCHWYTPWNCIAGFFCRAWYWVANWVCQGWYWVAKWVCKAWYWVAKWVCKAFAWVVKAVCTVLAWVLTLVCVAWDTARCALLALINALKSIFGKREPAKRKIDHVFFLMLENRSFDHMLGFSNLRGVDIAGIATTADGADPTRDKNVNPLTGADVFVSTPADFSLKNVDEDPGHEFGNVLKTLCGPGLDLDPVTHAYPAIDNSGFIQNYVDSGATVPERIMHCFSPDQLPVLNALAASFAVCDSWFSSLPGPTWPNRFFAMAGTSGGLDDSPSVGDIISATTIEGYRFENGNIFDLLDANCLKWRIFEGDEFPVSFALSGMNLNALQGRFSDFDEFAHEVNKYDFSESFIFIEPRYGTHEFDVTGPGDYTCGTSMHPLDDVTRGEALIKNVYETIRNSPHWERSMLIVTFDENGGFYDHVQPPAAVPPGDLFTSSYVQHGFPFDRLGVRVPALVISPYTPAGVIDHKQYDHTSMLATVERLYGMKNLTERDKAANDVLHLLSLSTARADAPTTLPDVAVNPSPLDCDDDALSEDSLMIQRSELRRARETGEFRQRSVEELKPTSTQIGFAQVALLRVLQNADYTERVQWLIQYQEMQTAVDAALFMTEAKLKLKLGINVKKFGTARETVARGHS